MNLGDLRAGDVIFDGTGDLVSDGFGDFVLLEAAGEDAFFDTDRIFSVFAAFLSDFAVALAFSCSRKRSTLRLLSFSSWASLAREACLAGIMRSGAMGSGLFGRGFGLLSSGDGRGISPADSGCCACVVLPLCGWEALAVGGPV
jgi:hypothetical protein